MDISSLGPMVFHLPGPDPIEDLRECVSAFHQALEEAIPDVPEQVPDYSGEEISAEIHRAMAQAQLALRLGPNALSDDTQAQGPKFVNLRQMSGLQKVLDQPDFAVPEPVDISSPRVEEFLAEFAPKALELWAALGESYASYSQDAEVPFLQHPENRAKLKAIRAAIGAAFHEAATKPALLAKFITPELSTMITKLAAEKNYAMVRSTGAEDTRTAANAGGNISVPYVPPTDEEVMRAVGAVVGSYFKKGSLKNRMDAGQNPFKENLQLAVLVQELIGEAVLANAADGSNVPSADIPTSFVCFSSEPLYIGTERFRTMRISATYGHGEGVVGTQGIATDYWLILHSDTHPHRLYVIPDIKKKPKRMAPVQHKPGEKPKLEAVPNPREMQKRPALSQQQLRSIFENAVIMEAFFGDKATDIEGICKGGKTYFVQARPVNRPQPEASYLDITKLAVSQRGAVLRSMQAIPLVPGRSKAIEVTDAKQVVTAETLEQALKLYKKDQHRLVIVSRPSPLLSHAVVNFSCLGVPCLLVQDQEALNQMIKGVHGTRPLEVCTQTASIYHWDTSVAHPAACVTQGFGKHPAKVSPSPLSRSIHLEKAPPPEEIRTLLVRIRAATTNQAAFAALQELHRNPLVARIHTLGRQHQEELQDPAASPKARQIARALLEYDAAVARTFQEAEALFSKPEQENRLQRLLHVELLETMLLGSLEEPGAVGRCNLMQVEPMSRAVKEMIAYQKACGERPALFVDHLMDIIYAPDLALFDVWKAYLLEAEGQARPAEATQFKEMLKTLRKSGSLPMWFTFAFFPWKSLRSMLSDFQDSEPLIETLTKYRTQIKQVGEQMDRFAQPETFDSAWSELSHIVAAFSSQDFLHQIPHAPPLVESMIYQQMERLVTTLDTAVKTMKMSSRMDDREKVERFKQMLLVYNELMARWALDVLPPQLIPTHADWGIRRIVNKIDEILKSTHSLEPRHLLPSENFSVSAAVLGSKTSFDRHLPETLEDLLTLQHQNLLAILGALNLASLPRAALEQSYLPTEFKKVLAVVERDFYHPNPVRMASGNYESLVSTIQRVGLTVNAHEIIYRGNYSLRNHSGQLELVYETSTQQMTMKAHFMGQARARWAVIEDWIHLLNIAGVMHLEGPVEWGAQELSFAWRVNPANIPHAMREFFQFGEYTMYTDGEFLNYDAILDRTLPTTESEENKRIVDDFVKFCEAKPASEFSKCFIKRAALAKFPRWIIARTPVALRQAVIRQLLAGSPSDQQLALNTLENAAEQQLMTRAEIAETISEQQFMALSLDDQRRAIRLAEGPAAASLPDRADLASPSKWIQMRAFYRIEKYLENPRMDLPASLVKATAVQLVASADSPRIHPLLLLFSQKATAELVDAVIDFYQQSAVDPKWSDPRLAGFRTSMNYTGFVCERAAESLQKPECARGVRRLIEVLNPGSSRVHPWTSRIESAIQDALKSHDPFVHEQASLLKAAIQPQAPLPPKHRPKKKDRRNDMGAF
jgi:hypothetical protein